MTAGSVLRFIIIVFVIAIAIGMVVRLGHAVRQRWRDRRGGTGREGSGGEGAGGEGAGSERA